MKWAAPGRRSPPVGGGAATRHGAATLAGAGDRGKQAAARVARDAQSGAACNLSTTSFAIASASTPSAPSSARPRRAARRRRPRAPRRAHRRRQIALLPAPRAAARGHHAGALAAHRADGRPGPRPRGARHRGDVPRLDARRATRTARRAPRRPRAGAYKLVYVAPERLACRRLPRRARRRPSSSLRGRRRGALHRAVGPRLPARLPAHRRGPRAAAPAARHRVHRDRDAGRARGDCARASAGTARRHDVVLRGFARPNLHLAVRRGRGPARGADRDARARSSRRSARRRRRAARAIVYAATRKATEQLAERLRETRLGRARPTTRGSTGERAPRCQARFAARDAAGRGRDQRVRDGHRSARRARGRPRAAPGVDRGVLPGGRAAPAATARRRAGCSCSSRRRHRAAPAALRRWARAAAAMPRPRPRARGALPRAALATSTRARCRHDFILRYFGDEAESLGGCGHCDVCLAVARARDPAALDARSRRHPRAPSPASRAPRRRRPASRRGDARRRCAPARGDAPGLDRALDLRRPRRPHAGGGDGASCARCSPTGWIDLPTATSPCPRITPLGWQVVTGQLAVRVRLPTIPRRVRKRSERSAPVPVPVPAPAPAPAPAPVPVPAPAPAPALFQALRGHRAAVARAKAVPPYIIAPDRTLLAIAKEMPRTDADLLRCHGMGPGRLAAYGAGLLEVVRAHVGAAGAALIGEPANE